MQLFEFDGKAPQVHPRAFVAPTATLVGDVIVEEDASVWYGAVLGEEALVANGCTVLDGARIGARTMVAAHSLVAAKAFAPSLPRNE